ncbi:MAG: hypothetical protein MSS97_04175 [Arcanobacterium sp.]|nr:hypothetical protein [Arcanobacterium sp.]
MRNRLEHHYDTVDDDTVDDSAVWPAINSDIPMLRDALLKARYPQ